MAVLHRDAAHPSTPRRFLALHLPTLATDRLRRAEPDLPDAPLALWTQEGHRRLLTAVDERAAAAGLRPGQPLADAQAIAPRLVLRPADAEADAAFLHRLALWALRLTPLAAADPPDGLLLDVTGGTALFGGEAALLDRAAALLDRAGIAARAALAGTPDAAAALARAGRHGAIVPPGGEGAALAPLPLAALRLPEETIAALHRVGLRRVGEVLRQPRAPLARRFGAFVLEALDVATGGRPRPIRPVRPPPDFTAAQDFLEPIVTREAIDAALDRLLPRLCRALRESGRGVRRAALLAFRVDGAVQEVAVGTFLPLREPAHLRRLFAEGLGRLEPGFGFDRLALEARATEPLGGVQAGLPGSAAAAQDGREALARLLDRLSQRLAVWRLAPRASHWPERAVARVGPFEGIAVPPGWPLPRPRPVRLLRRPVPLAVVAMVPDAPPSLLRFGGRGEGHRVLRAEGPERLEPEWWRDRPDRPFRDYYRVELASGARLWVCRAGPMGPEARWWLHGRLA